MGTLPSAPTGYTMSPSLLWIQGLKLLPPLLTHHPSRCNFWSDLASKDQKTFVFFPSPLLVSLKIIKPNLSCVAYLCQACLERWGWEGGWTEARDSGDPSVGCISVPFIAGRETDKVPAKKEAPAAQPSKLRCKQLAEPADAHCPLLRVCGTTGRCRDICLKAAYVF